LVISLEKRRGVSRRIADRTRLIDGVAPEFHSVATDQKLNANHAKNSMAGKSRTRNRTSIVLFALSAAANHIAIASAINHPARQ